YSVTRTPLDAIPDLSDVQVIIRTTYPGQAPRIVENQITYPLTTTMLSVPGAKTVRGYSFFGDSFVYVLFEDGTDLYWARSRVLEYLNQVQSRLPAGAKASIGPEGEPGDRRFGARARRGRVHGACVGLLAEPGRLPPDPADDHRRRRVGKAQ